MFFADALVKAKEKVLVTLESRTWAIATQGRGVRTRFSRRESSCSLPLVRNRSLGWDAWITRWKLAPPGTLNALARKGATMCSHWETVRTVKTYILSYRNPQASGDALNSPNVPWIWFMFSRALEKALLFGILSKCIETPWICSGEKLYQIIKHQLMKHFNMYAAALYLLFVKGEERLLGRFAKMSWKHLDLALRKSYIKLLNIYLWKMLKCIQQLSNYRFVFAVKEKDSSKNNCKLVNSKINCERRQSC